MVSVEFTAFRLVGIYLPNLLAKVPYWEALIAALKPESSGGDEQRTGLIHCQTIEIDLKN